MHSHMVRCLLEIKGKMMIKKIWIWKLVVPKLAKQYMIFFGLKFVLVMAWLVLNWEMELCKQISIGGCSTQNKIIYW